MDGREYFFISDSELENFIRSGKVIEVRRYNTVKGVWSYATIDDGQVDLESGNYILIGTLEAYEKLKSYYGAENIVPIYIACDDGVRLSRALKREQKQENPDYEEMCRRFLADSRDFRQERLREAGISKVYYNDDLNICINNIKNDLLRIGGFQ